MKNQNIVIMNQFEVPLSSESDFLEFFKTHIKLIASQDGNLECRLFKNTNDENSLNYTSIVCWQNQEAMEKAAANINQASEKAGIDIVAFQKEQHIKVVHRICSEVSIL